MQAKISIILPNLNHRKYLDERIDSILNQSEENWECIVIDGFSNDGSWDFFTQVAANDKRFRIYQYPPNGIYDAWNIGLNKAKGKYIYIATSDDTMYPEFLKKMSHALDENKNCDISYCNLFIIDNENKPVKPNWNKFPPPRYFGDFLNKSHIRYAPHDGILYSFLGIVNQSITQILIRNVLFKKIGFFKTDVGSIADFEWGMRAGLISNICHVPEYLATWRRHEMQATQNNLIKTYKHKENQRKLIKKAFKAVHNQFPEKISKIEKKDLLLFYTIQGFIINMKSSSKILVILKYMFLNTFTFIKIIRNYRFIRGNPKAKYTKYMVDKYKLKELIKNINNE